MMILFHSASITIAAGLQGSTFPFHTDPQYEITGGFVDGMGTSNLSAATTIYRSRLSSHVYVIISLIM
jgi:hypothetical protein